jgi:hypothetical protein
VLRPVHIADWPGKLATSMASRPRAPARFLLPVMLVAATAALPSGGLRRCREDFIDFARIVLGREGR